ncbi:MAG: TauD/TfdA family dioxygenase [Proteobacteria bacterium]|jgi:alpha-ketoglutarate-dependent taurine dioxygenase|nr:TauD/TfdA family dioxygenase [Pseudomonadota bacterium]
MLLARKVPSLGGATRIDYEVGTIAIWDNRCVLHSPCPDYDVSEERLMQRVTALCDARPVR